MTGTTVKSKGTSDGHSHPVLIPKVNNLLKRSGFQPQPLVEGSTLKLVAWVVSGKNILQRDCFRKRSTLSQMQQDQVQSIIINRLGENGIAGVVNGVLFLFDMI